MHLPSPASASLVPFSAVTVLPAGGQLATNLRYLSRFQPQRHSEKRQKAALPCGTTTLTGLLSLIRERHHVEIFCCIALLPLHNNLVFLPHVTLPYSLLMGRRLHEPTIRAALAEHYPISVAAGTLRPRHCAFYCSFVGIVIVPSVILVITRPTPPLEFLRGIRASRLAHSVAPLNSSERWCCDVGQRQGSPPYRTVFSQLISGLRTLPGPSWASDFTRR